MTIESATATESATSRIAARSALLIYYSQQFWIQQLGIANEFRARQMVPIRFKNAMRQK
jgi:hypothetical protein